MELLNTTGYHRRPAHLVAEYKGFFARENLQVAFHEATYAPDHNRGMAEGRWDFTLSSADTMIARTTTDGVDYLLFMQAEKGLSAYLVAQPEIRSIEQLRGKLLAGDPGDSNLDLIRKKILSVHGVAESEYRVEIIGSSPKRFEAFSRGRVAAAMLTPPHSEAALRAGAVLLASAEDYVPRWPLTCGWALRRWLLEHRSLVVRFIRAWASATDWLLAPENREETIELIMEKEKLGRASAEQAYGKVVPKARIDPEGLAAVLELRKEMGVYKPPYDPPQRFYDSSYWSEATGLAPV
ncbi:MAG TPA: ABC transporter substrate-binding protein [candidate division Zixibacteria bacterium]|nr:ABC transporter substrate-binding protein [candidate division Zixibacteria bacterium]